MAHEVGVKSVAQSEVSEANGTLGSETFQSQSGTVFSGVLIRGLTPGAIFCRRPRRLIELECSDKWRAKIGRFETDELTC